MMEEALIDAQQHVVMKECEEDKLEQIAKGGDVTEDFETKASKEDYGQRIYSKNSWLSMILMILCFMFAFVTRNMISTIVEGSGYSNELLASQRKMDDEHKCFMKTEHVNQLTELVADNKEVN